MGSKAIRPLYGGRSVAASTERRFRLGTWDLPWVYHGFNRCFLIFMIYMYISNIIYNIIYIYIMDWLYGISWSHWNPGKKHDSLNRQAPAEVMPARVAFGPTFKKAGTRSTGQLENDRKGSMHQTTIGWILPSHVFLGLYTVSFIYIYMI